MPGSTASVDSLAVTGLLRYSLPSNVSLIGGLRVERVSGEVALPAYGYAMSTDTDTRVGYVLGVAWEKPEIAARVALTYNSAMKHTLHSSESFAAGPLAGNYTTAFQTEVPQSVNLEFQTGVAVDTLVFGSVRWVNWEAFDITPPMFNMAAGPLVSYNHDTTTFNLGVGRKFNESWSAAVQAGYEKHHTTPTGNLGPHDGMKSLWCRRDLFDRCDEDYRRAALRRDRRCRHAAAGRRRVHRQLGLGRRAARRLQLLTCNAGVPISDPAFGRGLSFPDKAQVPGGIRPP